MDFYFSFIHYRKTSGKDGSKELSEDVAKPGKGKDTVGEPSSHGVSVTRPGLYKAPKGQLPIKGLEQAQAMIHCQYFPLDETEHFFKEAFSSPLASPSIWRIDSHSGILGAYQLHVIEKLLSSPIRNQNQKRFEVKAVVFAAASLAGRPPPFSPPWPQSPPREISSPPGARISFSPQTQACICVLGACRVSSRSVCSPKGLLPLKRVMAPSQLQI